MIRKNLYQYHIMICNQDCPSVFLDCHPVLDTGSMKVFKELDSGSRSPE